MAMMLGTTPVLFRIAHQKNWEDLATQWQLHVSICSHTDMIGDYIYIATPLCAVVGEAVQYSRWEQFVCYLLEIIILDTLWQICGVGNF